MAHSGSPRAKKAATIALGILGGLVALAAIVTGGTILVLRTDWGGERLRRQVVSRVNKQIYGRLGIERLSFGGDKVQVWGVTLTDPEGGLVARVARAEVDFALLPVLRKELRVTAVVIETPTINIVSDDDGSNLSRATAARNRPPKAAQDRQKPVDRHGPEGWVFRLDRFDLTHGDIRTAVAAADDEQGTPTPQGHLSNLGVFVSARIATGNGATDLTLRVSGQSERAPVGPLRLVAQLAAHGDVTRFDADGAFLGGTLKAHGNVDSRRLENADVLVALAIARQDLAGYAWGPIRIDGRAEPQKAPKLDALVRVPGIELSAKDRGLAEPGVQGRLAVADLAVTGKAAQALTGADLPPLGGHGEVTFAFEKPRATGAVGFDAQTKGSFGTLRFGETVFGGIAFAAQVRQQDVSATFGLASPARVDLDLEGRLSEDGHVFDLSHLALAFPGGRWESQGVARLRSDENEASLSKFRLTSEGQSLAIDGARRGEDLSAHLALTELRLGKLPTALMDPKLRLDGVLNVDIKVEGKTDAPKVVARVDLKQAEVQGLAKLDAKLDAKLENDQLDGTMDVNAPFLTANGAFKLPTDLGPGEPFDVKMDVKHLDVGQLMRAAERPPLADGRLNLKLRAEGSADDPRVTLTMEAFDLELKRPKDKMEAAKSVDLGKAHVRVTYADRAARAEVDFASAHGGTLVIDASSRVDLSYPAVKRRPVVKSVEKLPITGKVVARDLDVAWVAQLNPRVESMGGQVTADARLGGTVGDPQVVGDVRWKNGKVVATPPPRQPPDTRKRPAAGAPQGRPAPSAR